MAVIDQQELKRLLKYNPDTGVFYWLESRGGVHAGCIAGSPDTNGYVQIRINTVAYLAHRLALFYTNGIWPSEQVDHINGVKNDNRICNLRNASPVENMRNTRLSRNNTSGIKGVCWHKGDKKWHAKCRTKGEARHLGCFTDIGDAERAVREFREATHGEFANNGGKIRKRS
ncbi:Pathogenesis-related transcriptional factor and ERF protein [Salmonella enterica]|nr:Pathogenesis-related transcriptional factor and ERF protein [Salmonella enterica subsp. enterica serovar Telelkebir]ECZ9741628.1 Pathogenesis-related transcriptional factor and ERF protein [Salmonella enterica subsp. enterica serovar Telelkebir]EDA0854531.1 Pathogenesis-related transcriptional factor and ERF protein [Salmonella enterica]MIN79523.1 Pathogenesis-related transcriptional factor and ERF protein [Salmonella enterica subsp. enterica]